MSIVKVLGVDKDIYYDIEGQSFVYTNTNEGLIHLTLKCPLNVLNELSIRSWNPQVTVTWVFTTNGGWSIRPYASRLTSDGVYQVDREAIGGIKHQGELTSVPDSITMREIETKVYNLQNKIDMKQELKEWVLGLLKDGVKITLIKCDASLEEWPELFSRMILQVDRYKVMVMPVCLDYGSEAGLDIVVEEIQYE